MTPRTRESIGVVALFGVLAVVKTFPVVLNIGDALPGGLGDPLLNAWILAWDADRLWHGLRGLWDAPFFFPYGNTLGYSEHLLGVAIFTTPLQWLSSNPLLVYNAAFLASYVLAGAGMYLLVRSLTGRWDAALVAGAAFAFGPFRDGQISHLQVLMSGWMPIALWALHRYFASGHRRALALFAGAFLLQGLSNGYFFYYFSVPVILVSLHGVWRTNLPRRRVLSDLTAAAVLMGLALVPVASMYFELGQDQPFARSRGSIINYSADIASYWQVTDRVWVWRDVLTRHARGSLFPGAIMLLLAAVGLVGRWRLRRRPDRLTTMFERPYPGIVLLYVVILIVGFFLSLGPEPRAWGQSLGTGPYELLLSVVPGLDGLRAPLRMSVVVYVALAVLAGFGFAWIAQRVSPSVRAAVSGILVALILVEGHGGLMHVEAFGFDESETELYSWLKSAPRGAALELPLGGPPTTLRYQFATLEHGHPIVNGYSGHRSSLYAFLADSRALVADSTNLRSVIRGLRELGVLYVVVHIDRFRDPEAGRAVVRTLEEDVAQTLGTAEFGPATVVRLKPETGSGPQPQRPGEEVLLDGYRMTASSAEERLPLTQDGNLSTRWVSAGSELGDEWVQVDFDVAQDVRRVRLEHGRRTWKNYPRGLRVEVSTDGESFEGVAEVPGLDRVIVGLARDSRGAPIDVVLPANRSLAVRLRQTGPASTNPWAISELSLWTGSETTR